MRKYITLRWSLLDSPSYSLHNLPFLVQCPFCFSEKYMYCNTSSIAIIMIHSSILILSANLSRQFQREFNTQVVNGCLVLIG